MAFRRLTTKWRIFRSDLLSENGTQTNCQIIRVGAKLHNYVINADRLNFRHVPDDNFDTLEVEALVDGPNGNVGYLPIPIENMRKVGREDDFDKRRNIIIDLIKEDEDLIRPDRNIRRNA